MSEISDEEILIFARVPKTGSLGINHLLMHLRDIHNFTSKLNGREEIQLWLKMKKQFSFLWHWPHFFQPKTLAYSSIEGMPTKDGDTEYLYETDKHFRYLRTVKTLIRAAALSNLGLCRAAVISVLTAWTYRKFYIRSRGFFLFSRNFCPKFTR